MGLGSHRDQEWWLHSATLGLLLLCFLALFLVSCGDDLAQRDGSLLSPLCDSGPTISSLDPQSGTADTTLAINGENLFAEDLHDFQVTIGGTTAEIKGMEGETAIIVTVPHLEGECPQSNCDANVELLRSDGCIARSERPFQYFESDTDGDGLSDFNEAECGSDPIIPDTDFDGLTDYEECKVYETDPTLTDTDGDGRSDYDEVVAGTPPLDDDNDGDGVATPADCDDDDPNRYPGASDSLSNDTDTDCRPDRKKCTVTALDVDVYGLRFLIRYTLTVHNDFSYTVTPDPDNMWSENYASVKRSGFRLTMKVDKTNDGYDVHDKCWAGD